MKVTFDLSKFMEDIDAMRRKTNVEYIDAVVFWCEKNNVEVEYVAAIIKKDPVFKSKIMMEAEELNFMKKTQSLPF